MIGGWIVFGALVILGAMRERRKRAEAEARAAEVKAAQSKAPEAPAKRPVGRPRKTHP